MKKMLVLLWTVLAVLLSACSTDLTENEATGSIVGSVSDQTTGEPVATVNVTLSPVGSQTVTGSDGVFSFPNLNEGAYTIIINKEGYKSNTTIAYVNAGVATSVHMLIERIPSSITADRTLLDFGNSLTTLSFTIVNSGYTDLAYKVETGDCKWLSVDPETDILAFGKTATIVVSVDRSMLPAGDNEANIVVRSTSGDGNVEVKVMASNNAQASVNTLEATDVTSSTAVLNGEITNVGTPAYTERGFVYDTQSTPTLESCTDRLSVPVNSNSKFSCNIGGLSPTYMYYARAYIVQEGNVIYGNIVAFSASQQPTSVSTSAVTKIGANSATFNGSISNAGMPAYSEKGFCYAKNDMPTIENNRRQVSGSGEGNFSLQVYDLEYPANYYVRAYAIQAGNVVYGNVVAFSTNQSSTTISTSAVTEIGASTATFNASISDEGMPAYTERGFCYSKYGNPTIATNRRQVGGSGTGNYSLQVADLEYPVTYYVCAYAIQDGNPVYGNIVTFSTEMRQAYVSTSAATDISGTSAKLNGIVSDVGLPAYTQRGFCYSSTTSMPTIANDKISEYAYWAGSFNKTVSNLQAGTTYYVRAYVVQDNEYVYGNTVSFTTNSEPIVRTNSVTDLATVDLGGGLYFQWKATFNAIVIDVGSPAYSGRGFVYGTTVNPTVGSGTSVNLTGSGTGSFSATVTNLTNMQTYYVRAYVKVGSKYYYGESVSFSTYDYER